MIINAYAHASRESMYDLGLKSGLEGKALDYFSYALGEVTLGLEVDPATGKAVIISVDGRKIEQIAVPIPLCTMPM